MLTRLLILPFLSLLSMPITARAAASDSGDNLDISGQGCVQMRLSDDVAHSFGENIIAQPPAAQNSVTLQPVMAGLRGPSLTLLGRDVKLARAGRASPQELWKKSAWNAVRPACPTLSRPWMEALQQDFYWNSRVDTQLGYTTYQPKILYRSRMVLGALLTRPFGFTLGGAVAVPLAGNTDALMWQSDTRAPVRRDMARFSNGGELERLYIAWRHTPVTDLHIAASAGWLEEMYGGAGGEIVYRPFGRPYWMGADGWQVWRRDAAKPFNSGWRDGGRFTGHIRAGYDFDDSRWSVAAAAGRYLAGDFGTSVTATRSLENGGRIEAGVTWTNRDENEGFFRDSHVDPMVRLRVPLGRSGHRDAVITFRQVGRDGGQMLDRPAPLEQMTEAFAARNVIRAWPDMLAR